MSFPHTSAERTEQPKVFTAADPEPDLDPGSIVAVHYGDYRRQECWVASGANIGNWYPLGGEFWVVWDRQRMPAGVTKSHPVWADVVARGPVTVLVPGQADAYASGWIDGRRRLLEQVEELRDAEDVPLGHGWRAGAEADDE